jgi:hypothetical protein
VIPLSPTPSFFRHARRALLVLLTAAAPAGTEPVALRTTRVPLDREHPERTAVGPLEYRGGLHVTSSDPRFGGISAMRVLPGGERLVAITDEGSWLTARLVLENGVLRGIAEAEMGPLRGEDALPLQGKSSRDAESLEVLPDGSFLVGFEREHRIMRYPAGTGRPDGVPTRLAPPDGLERAAFNGGVETIVALRDGQLLLLLEEGGPGPNSPGWIGRPGEWRRVALSTERPLRPSDATLLPGGDLLVLERGYDANRGITSVRLREVPARDVRTGAVLGGATLAELKTPLTVDNFEGVSAWSAEGETRVLLVSDDNFNAAAGQRTLLMLFRLAVPAVGRPSSPR